MLKLVFHIGPAAYSISASSVKEVVPLLPLQPMSGSPEYFAGMLTYRGQALPVIDLCSLVTGKSAARCFSTRIMVIHATKKNQPQLLGLIGEDITQIIPNGDSASPADIETVLPRSMYDFLLDLPTS
jgi:chemotaxis-related protein WspB